MTTRHGSRIRSIVRAADSFRAYPECLETWFNTRKEWVRTLDVEPVSAVEWACPEGWSIRNRAVADDMAFCILSGQYAGCVEHEKNEQPVNPGGMLLIPRGTAHWIRRISGDCRMVSLHMHARVCGSVDALSVLGLGGIHRKPPGDVVRRTARRLAREDARRPVGWKRTLRAGMETIVLEALRYAPAPEQSEPLAGPVREIARLRPALELLRARLDDPSLRVADLAAAAHVSEPALRTWFRNAFGLSPVHFLRRERVARARMLLLTTDDTIDRIAEASGFNDVPFFYRVFKQQTATTPARYRERGEV